MPFRRQVGYWTCVVVGRWIGGLLGYKPFFKEYTTDWDFAVAKMKGSIFQRHLVHEAFNKEKSWDEQDRLSSGNKPFNAEFEQWTVDLSEAENMTKSQYPNGYADRVMNGLPKGLTNGHSNGSLVNGHASKVTKIS